jgi:hypothetical protein
MSAILARRPGGPVVASSSRAGGQAERPDNRSEDDGTERDEPPAPRRTSLRGRGGTRASAVGAGTVWGWSHEVKILPAPLDRDALDLADS